MWLLSCCLLNQPWCTFSPMADLMLLCPLQPPVPVPTPNPCLAIDPHCTSCSGGVCTACNIIFTLDSSTKKCGKPHCPHPVIPASKTQPTCHLKEESSAGICLQCRLCT